MLVHRDPHLAGNLADGVLVALREAGLTDTAENGHGSNHFGGYIYYRAER
jgi:hypothetical protein